VVDKQDEEKTKLKKLLNMSVNEIELSVAPRCCLNNANITTVGQLAMKSEQEVLKYRNLREEVAERDQGEAPGPRLALGMTLRTRFARSTQRGERP